MSVTHNVKLDVAKNRMRLDQKVHVRTGDKNSQTVKCALTKDGSAYTPASGTTAKLEILKPDNTWTVTNATVSGSNVSGVVPLEAMSAPGECKRAYFRLISGSTEDTTEDFHLYVFPNATQEAIESRPYSDQFQELLESCESEIAAVLSDNSVIIAPSIFVENFDTGYIDCNGSVDVPVAIDTIIQSANWMHAVVDCEPGDCFHITGTGSVAARLFCFVDENNMIIRRSSTALESENLVIVAPPKTEKVILQVDARKRYRIIKGNTPMEHSVGVLELLYSLHGFEQLTLIKGYYIDLGGDISQPVDFALNVNNDYSCFIEDCLPGDEFTYYGVGAASARPYAFLDSSNMILERAGNVTGSDCMNVGDITSVVLVAPPGAAKFVSNVKNSKQFFVAKRKSDNTDVVVSHLSDAETDYGRIKTTTGEFVPDGKFIACTDYLPDSVTAVQANIDGVKIAVGRWNKSTGEYDGYHAWVRKTWYILDHDAYNYKIWWAYNDESFISDKEAALAAVNLNESVRKIAQSYHSRCFVGKGHGQDIDQDTVGYLFKRIMKADYHVEYANALQTIELANYLGNTQNVHPKVLYFENGLFGYKYWMAYTPYPNGNDLYENPCIAYSKDGAKWIDFPENPLDDPQGDGYDSDTHLVYREDKGWLECWYRYVGAGHTPVEETILRRITTDGVTWGSEQTVMENNTGNYSNILSPAVIWDGEKYMMWTIKNRDAIYLRTVSDSLVVSGEPKRIHQDYIDENGKVYRPWHLDVIEDEGRYIYLVMCKQLVDDPVMDWVLFLFESTDGNETFSTPTVVMRGAEGRWDEQMYRSSIVKTDSDYRIYYSGIKGNSKGVYGLGMSVAEDYPKFIGQM